MSENAPRQWLSPAFVKGATLVVAGLVVVTAPDLSRVVLRLVLAVALAVTGASDLWGYLRHRGDRHRAYRGALALAAGVALLIVPGAAARGLVLVLAAYLTVAGLLACWRAYQLTRSGEGRGVHLIRGGLSLAFAVLLLVLPGPMLTLAIAATAVAAIAAGLVMISYAMTHAPGEAQVVERGLVVEIFRGWLGDRDVGPERRTSVADSLYFEAPDRTHKVTSYVVMLFLSVGIASLAVLQDSTAVVIGAMLVAPLMTPIMGCAAGLVAGWRRRVLDSLSYVALSVVAAIGLAWILASWIPALVPLATNSQVLSRSSPTLLDMAIAVVAGAAGAYATVDDRVSASLPGVAIAVALVPPLAVVGISLQAGHGSAALGAFLLFGTNLVSIILASVVVFVLVGFTPIRVTKQGRAAIADLLSTVVVLALLIMVPLGLTGEGVLRDAARRVRAQTSVEAWLGSDTTLRLVKVTTRGDRVDVMLSGSGELPSVEALEGSITRSFGAPVTVAVEVFPSAVVTYSQAEGRRELGALPETHD